MLLSVLHSPGWGYEIHCQCMPEDKVLRARPGEDATVQSVVRAHAKVCEHRVDGQLRALDEDEVRRLRLEPGAWFTDDDPDHPKKPPFAT